MMMQDIKSLNQIMLTEESEQSNVNKSAKALL